MFKTKIEDILSGFYDALMHEYEDEPEEMKRGRFNHYIDEEVRDGLEDHRINIFNSSFCYPLNWKHPIQLWVSINPIVEIYFTSYIDLSTYVQDLVTDENFKDLVKVAFYIKNNISPR